MKNEWADRLAQQAAARLHAAKSSLLADSGSGSEGNGRAGSSSWAPGAPSSWALQQQQLEDGPARGWSSSLLGPPGQPSGGSTSSATGGAEPPIPAQWRGEGSGALADGGGGASWRNGPSGAYEPDSSASRPRTNMPSRMGLGLGRADDMPVHAPAAAAARPRLQLQPRTKAGEDGGKVAEGGGALQGAARPPAASAAPSASSIFGAARPREEVLKERGGSVTDAALPPRSGSAAALLGAAARGSGGPGSVASGVSGEDDQWHVVGKGGRAKGAVGGSANDSGNALLDEVDDPFFARPANGHGVALVGRAIPAFGGAFGGNGSYSRGGYSGGFGRGRGYGDAQDDEPIFKRSLPTRDDHPLF